MSRKSLFASLFLFHILSIIIHSYLYRFLSTYVSVYVYMFFLGELLSLFHGQGGGGCDSFLC